MIITKKLGNLKACTVGLKNIDLLHLEWYESNKRILHKKTDGGKEVRLKFMNEAANLQPGDILWQDDETIIAIVIKPCEAMVITPATLQEMAAICYEIGNKHLPLFYNNGQLMVPFETPLFNMLVAAGYHVVKSKCILSNALKTTVSPHGMAEGKQTLFSKILQLTTSPAAHE